MIVSPPSGSHFSVYDRSNGLADIPFYMTAWEPSTQSSGSGLILGKGARTPPEDSVADEEHRFIDQLFDTDFPPSAFLVDFLDVYVLHDDGTRKPVPGSPAGFVETGVSFSFAYIPLWMMAAIVGLVTGYRFYLALGRRRRRRWIEQGCCAACGYDLRATPDRCPECGTIPVVRYARRPRRIPQISPLRRRFIRMSVPLRRNIVWICAIVVLLGALLRPPAPPRHSAPAPIVDPEAFVKAQVGEHQGNAQYPYPVFIIYNLADLYDARISDLRKKLVPPVQPTDSFDYNDWLRPYVLVQAQPAGHIAFIKRLNALRRTLQ
jgi:hypothetical protein